MSLKHANAAALVAFTTGAGVAIGTNVDISGVHIGSVATTVTIKSGTATLMEVVGQVDFYPPVACNGVITATSSGGSFYVAYSPR